jgi:hypothetical protein
LSPPLRLVLALAAVVATALTVAIVAALVELYVTGHGHGSIMREVVRWPAAGVHLSVPDIVMLLAGGAAGILTWRLTRGSPPARDS